ncbi:MAG: hypothetical protein U0R50_09180 [Gaiellales bacterium]
MPTPMALRSALKPGAAIERYGREWRMARWNEEKGFFNGRIGYERVGERTTLWDDSVNDFKATRIREGTTSPFAIDPERGVVAFQLRPGRINPHSFTGALRALLNASGDEEGWSVEPYVREVGFEQWVETVDRVTRLEIRLDRPNPHYHGLDEIEELIEGTRSRSARIILEADPANLDGIDINDQFIVQAIEHAHEYGKITAQGASGQGGATQVEPKWRSDVEGSPEEATVPADPNTREASADELRSVAGEAEPQPPVGADGGQ